MECTMDVCERVRIFLLRGQGELLDSNSDILFISCIMDH